MKLEGFLVWNPRAGFPTMAHSTIEQAVAESERLAKANPGHRFFVMAPVGSSHVEPQRIYEPSHDWQFIPF